MTRIFGIGMGGKKNVLKMQLYMQIIFIISYLYVYNANYRIFHFS
jgi:hypothetical protein